MTQEIATVELCYTESFGQGFESKMWKLAVHFGVLREFSAGAYL